MYLALKDLASLFDKSRGIQDDLLFMSVSDQAHEAQPKGLFVSLNGKSGELSEAIVNGAIAAIWNQEHTLPNYTPNHFPVFFTDDPMEAIVTILKRYIEKLNGETDKIMEITNVKFSNKELLNKNKDTYDIAVMLNQVTSKSQKEQERRE
jgi:UDP-N-acetylmuramyl pentapeptide synthase